MKLTNIKAQFIKETSFFWAAPAVLWQVLFLYIPLAFIVYLSFTKPAPAAWWPSFTLEHYRTLFDVIYLRIIARSLFMALTNVCVCFLFAYPIAYFVALRARTWKNILLFLLILPFWTNFLVQVYAWFSILGNQGLLNHLLMSIGLIKEPIHILNTSVAVFIVMAYCYLPFMVIPIYTKLEQLDVRLLEASADLGATPLATFARVILPLSLPGIRNGFFLVFIPSFGEFVIPSLLGGSKKFYVGSLITQYFLNARNPWLGAAFTCFSAFFLIVVVVLIKWFLRDGTHADRR